MEKKKHPLFNRRNFISTTILGATGAFAYARFIEPNQLSITQKDIHIHHLPDSLDGLTVVQMTDFHYQPDQQDELMKAAVEAANAANPDIIALTGDFITKTTSVFDPLMAHLAGLKAKHGIYSILGNHDGWHGQLNHFQHGFRKTGVEFLFNQGTRIDINGEKLFIIGTDSVWSGHVDAPSCYRGYHTGSQEPVLALVHEPDVFDTLTAQFPVSLQLSGHTHGGQCRVPVVGYAPVTVRYGRNYIYGEYTKGDAKIFVSRGLGTVGTRVRFACTPEVAVLTLRSKPV